MTRRHGPKPGLELAACRARGCQHPECAAAAAAHARADNLTALAETAGCRRRLQALISYGWPPAELARRLNIPVTAVTAITCKNAPVTGDIPAAVHVLYDEMWNVRGGSRSTQARARARGWPPPLAWDDDPEDGHGIDDPGAVPAPSWQRTSKRAVLDDVIEDLAELTRQGCIKETAAQRLGRSPDALDALVRRHRRRPTAQAGAEPEPAGLAS
jgi:hypothetical protein